MVASLPGSSKWYNDDAQANQVKDIRNPPWVRIMADYNQYVDESKGYPQVPFPEFAYNHYGIPKSQSWSIWSNPRTNRSRG